MVELLLLPTGSPGFEPHNELILEDTEQSILPRPALSVPEDLPIVSNERSFDSYGVTRVWEAPSDQRAVDGTLFRHQR